MRKGQQSSTVSEMNTIEVQRSGKAGIIFLNRPERLNALTVEMAEEIEEALRELDSDPQVRVIVITGRGKAFSAGADVREMSNMPVEEVMRKGHAPLWEGIRRTRKPIIAALNGVAAGGGFELAMSCDLIIAERSVKVGQPEINLGIIPGAGGTQRLTRTIGKYRAMELILTGRLISAEEAYQWGLLTKIVEDGRALEESMKLVEEIANRPPVAIELAKESVNRATETLLRDGLDIERRNFYITLTTQEGKEGMKAFIEKRKPNW